MLSQKSLRLSRNNKYKSNDTGYTRRKNFSRNLLRIFPLQSTSPRTNVLRFSPGAACSSTVSWLSRVSWREAVSLERSGYQFDSDAVRGGEARTCGREDERAM